MLKKLSSAAIGALLMLTGTAGAQNFPTHPMVMVIPFAAGGPQDVLGRIIAQSMGEALGQTVIIDSASAPLATTMQRSDGKQPRHGHHDHGLRPVVPRRDVHHLFGRYDHQLREERGRVRLHRGRSLPGGHAGKRLPLRRRPRTRGPSSSARASARSSAVEPGRHDRNPRHDSALASAARGAQVDVREGSVRSSGRDRGNPATGRADG